MLAVAPAIASGVTAQSRYLNEISAEALLEGYKAGFWLCFAASASSCLTCAAGLRADL